VEHAVGAGDVEEGLEDVVLQVGPAIQCAGQFAGVALEACRILGCQAKKPADIGRLVGIEAEHPLERLLLDGEGDPVGNAQLGG
jgi:hypothetical protein